MRILACQMNPIIGDLKGNGQKIIEALQRAKTGGAKVVVFPELTLCGYFPDDLLLLPCFIEDMAKKLEEIAPYTEGMFVVLGLARKNPLGKEKPLYNSAAVFQDQKLVGFKDKTLLPTYDVFDERRFFEPGEKEPIWEFLGRKIAVTICEDVWQKEETVYTKYEKDPIEEIERRGVDLHLNLSGSPYFYQKKEIRKKVFREAAKRLKCPTIFCNQVGANDQLIFDGHSFCMNEKGEVTQAASGFVEEDLWIDLGQKGFLLKEKSALEDLYSALVLGVRDYFYKQGFKKAVLGLSGGVDSALVCCIAKEALGEKNVLGLTLPSKVTSKESLEDANALAERLGIEVKNISIEEIFDHYLSLLKPHFLGFEQDETEENLQSRIRGMILMAFSNKLGHLLLNTGNKSEMAMGFCTLYGDMAGALGVLHDVSKTRVYELARHVKIIPTSILTKAPSAELRENQKDEDTLPPYEVLDPILEDLIEERMSVREICKKRGFSLELVQEIVKKVNLAEYKRRQAPISLRVTKKAFNKGRKVPIVYKYFY